MNMNVQGNIEEKIYCSTCKVKTNHGYVEKYEINSAQFPDADFGFSDKYFITKCLGCDSFGFLREYGDEQTFNRFGELYTEKYIYPEEPLNAIHETYTFKYDIKKFQNAPDIIQELYDQVVSSFESEHYLLAAVGLRMMIEGFCIDQNVTKGYIYDEIGNKKKHKKGKNKGEAIISKSLEGRINGLEEKRLINFVSSKILHQIRDLGNVTAHELEIPKRNTIKKGLSIMEDLIRTVYEYQNMKI